MMIVDARPILRRTDDNLWDRTENLRSQLYGLIEDTCLKLGLEALVLQSDPYVHPAWVKVESWKPEQDGALTARSSLMVTITAMPYHRYEAVYRVAWEKQGRGGMKDHLYAFREHEVAQMLRVLLTGPSLPPFGDGEVKWILGPLQLRTEWWQLWRPRNKVVALRQDWARAASGALLVAGALITLGTLAAQSDDFEGGGDDLSMYDTTAAGVPPANDTIAAPVYPDTMAVVATTDTVITTVWSDTTTGEASSSGPGSIFPYQEVAGYLGPDDPVFAGTTAHYEEWRYVAQQGGERITVSMRSNDFDSFVTVGQRVGGSWTTLAFPADTLADGMNSQLEVVLPAAGEYAIAAGSALPDRTGNYTLWLANR